MFGPKVTRTCNKCGKSVKYKAGPRNGALCKSGHFICAKCQIKAKGFFSAFITALNPFSEFKGSLGGFTSDRTTKCPICKEKLRVIKTEDIKPPSV